MVTQGQFLERPTLIATEQGFVLEGLSHRGSRRPLLLVLPPPPAEGGSMDHVLAAELVFAAAQAGYPTLRFNYRGVGASQGPRFRQGRPERGANRTRDSRVSLLHDAAAAYDLAVENASGAKPAIASLGAADAVAWQLTQSHAVAGLLFVNPSLISPEEVACAPMPLAVVVAELDAPVLAAKWSSMLESRGETLTVVPGADRRYQRNLPMVGKAATAFLTRIETTR